MPPTTIDPANCAGTGDNLNVLVDPIETVGGDDRIGSILDDDLAIPGIVHESVMILILGQVAVIVISRCHRPADTRDFILFGGRPEPIPTLCGFRSEGLSGWRDGAMG